MCTSPSAARRLPGPRVRGHHEVRVGSRPVEEERDRRSWALPSASRRRCPRGRATRSGRRPQDAVRLRYGGSAGMAESADARVSKTRGLRPVRVRPSPGTDVEIDVAPVLVGGTQLGTMRTVDRDTSARRTAHPLGPVGRMRRARRARLTSPSSAARRRHPSRRPEPRARDRRMPAPHLGRHDAPRNGEVQSAPLDPDRATTVLVAVGTLTGPPPAPIPVLRGGGVRWTQLASVTKVQGGVAAPRRLTLFASTGVGSGPLTISVPPQAKQDMSWSVVEANGRIVQLGSTGTAFAGPPAQVSLPEQPTGTVVAFFLVGTGSTIRAAPRPRSWGKATRQRPGVRPRRKCPRRGPSR